MEPTYPHFVQDGLIYLRYNSPTWVCVAGPAQLQAQHLSTPRTLHGAQAQPCTEQAFKSAAEASYVRLLAAYQSPARADTSYQRRREMPDAWYYRQDGPQVELRLNVSQVAGQTSVNWLLEDLNSVPGVLVAFSRGSDPRRVASTAQEYNTAIKLAVPALIAAARGEIG